MHRERHDLDEFQPTSSQPSKDGADMVGLLSSSIELLARLQTNVNMEQHRSTFHVASFQHRLFQEEQN